MGRSNLRVLVVCASLGLGLGACGDDDTAPVDAGTDARPTPAATTTSTGSSGSTGGPPTPTTFAVDCPIGTTVEFEPNDTTAQANVMKDLAFCGAISPGTDVDYARFDTPAGKKLTGFVAKVEGKLAFDLVVNGKTLKPTDVKTFESGSYVVKVYTTDAKPGKYSFRVQFEP